MAAAYTDAGAGRGPDADAEADGTPVAVGKNATVVVTVTARNVGTARSAVTAQLYYSPPVAPYGVLRHARRLITFQRARLGPGEATDVVFRFEVADALSRWDEFAAEWDQDASPGFVVDPGLHGLHVGDCCVSGVVDSSATCSDDAQVSANIIVQR